MKRETDRDRESKEHKDSEEENVRLTLLDRFESSPEPQPCALPRRSEGPSQTTLSVYSRHAHTHKYKHFFDTLHYPHCLTVATPTHSLCLLGFAHNTKGNATVNTNITGF